MGVRFFTLQMIPMCFHINNTSSCDNKEETRQPPHVKATKQRAVGGDVIKVVKSDGLVKIYDKPVDVSELMRQFPKHLVCASDSFYIGQKIPPLSEHDQLQLGQKYFLLPKQFFRSILTFVTIASFASAFRENDQTPSVVSSLKSKNAILRKAATCEPFQIQKSETGCLRIRVTDEFISQLLEEGKLGEVEKEAEVVQGDDDDDDDEDNSKVCTTAQLKKDYSQLVGTTRRQWKPRLEPIRETRETKRRSRLGSFGMRRAKKKTKPNSSSSSKAAKTSSKTGALVKSEHHSKAKNKLKSSKK